MGPPDQVGYTGKFTFKLEDGDGFILAKITGPDERITARLGQPDSGGYIVKRTKRIAVSFDAAKCNVCDEQRRRHLPCINLNQSLWLQNPWRMNFRAHVGGQSICLTADCESPV